MKMSIKSIAFRINTSNYKPPVQVHNPEVFRHSPWSDISFQRFAVFKNVFRSCWSNAKVNLQASSLHIYGVTVVPTLISVLHKQLKKEADLWPTNHIHILSRYQTLGMASVNAATVLLTSHDPLLASNVWMCAPWSLFLYWRQREEDKEA